MTRRFRLGLFVSMAAAAGLHLRPCWTCCEAVEPQELPCASQGSTDDEQIPDGVIAARPALRSMGMASAFVAR